MPPFLVLLRPTQWVKNIFVLPPIFFTGQLLVLDSVISVLYVFFTFVLCSSLIYIINDIRDVESDRKHPIKCQRPLASGAISRNGAILVLCILALGILVLVAISSPQATLYLVITAYVVISISYSFGLKNIPLLEMFIVSLGYILRLVGGCIAIDVSPSPWILGAIGVLSLLIVTGKRRSELASHANASEIRPVLKEYSLSFLDSIISILSASAITFYMMYTNSEYAAEKYTSQYVQYTIIFVIYGILRYNLLIVRGTAIDSPTDLILRDVSLIVCCFSWVTSLFVLLYLL